MTALIIYGTGDRIYIILGCRLPIVLRRTQSRDFRVVGPCYARGLTDGEGLLGPIPQPWELQYRNIDGYRIPNFFNTLTETVSTEDPRLGHWPIEWETVQRQRTADDPYEFAHFRNKVTGAVMNGDPRMLPEALRQRGIELKTIRLL